MLVLARVIDGLGDFGFGDLVRVDPAHAHALLVDVKHDLGRLFAGFLEDVLQDVFIKIWEIRGRIKPELSFSGYLYRITRNHVFKLLKKITADEALRLRVMQDLYQQTTDADTLLQWKQYETLLHSAIDRLPPQRQKVFRLCREELKSYEEVARELGISRNTVKEHMMLAMKSIRFFVYSNADGILPLLLAAALLKDISRP